VVDLAAKKLHRVPGTAVFMTRATRGLPQVLLHHIKHNRVLHQRVILLSVETLPVPEAGEMHRIEVQDLGQGLFRVILRHGFMETPLIEHALTSKPIGGEPVELSRTSFYLGRETILPRGSGRMARWRKRLFSVMSRIADPATLFFELPPNRVIELGKQVAL
jgi:KUP system potassium uptake protein